MKEIVSHEASIYLKKLIENQTISRTSFIDKMFINYINSIKIDNDFLNSLQKMVEYKEMTVE